MEDKKFAMKYKLQAQFGQFDSKDALTAGEDWGVADAVLFGILVNHDGGASSVFTLMDGHNAGQNNPVKMMQAWIMLTKFLADKADIPESLKAMPKKYAEFLEEKLGVVDGNSLQ